MRFVWTLLLIPLAGCVMDDPYVAPPPPTPAAYYAPASACAPPVANSCSGGVRPVAYASPVPQTQEPPR